MFNDVHARLDHTRAKSYCMIAWSPSWARSRMQKGILTGTAGYFNSGVASIPPYSAIGHHWPLGHWLVVSALFH